MIMKKLLLFVLTLNVAAILAVAPVYAESTSGLYTVIDETLPTEIQTFYGNTYSYTLSNNNVGEDSILTACNFNSMSSANTTNPALKVTTATLTVHSGATDVAYPLRSVTQLNDSVQQILFGIGDFVTTQAGDTISITLQAKPIAQVIAGNEVTFSFVCGFEWTDAGSIDHTDQAATPESYVMVVDGIPATLRNLYPTFGKYRYGRYVAPYAARSGDMAYLKNYDPKKVQLLSISLYDYSSHKNQCYSRTWKSSTSLYIKTCANLPTGRGYAYIFTFRDIATGKILKKYFVINTLGANRVFIG
jgi:hypothetical protein